MTIRSRATDMIWIDSTYSDTKFHTVEVNFAPKTAQASVAMCQFDGHAGGFGIHSYEYRDTPSGLNKKAGYEGIAGPLLLPSVHHKLMTRVTFLVNSQAAACYGSWTIDFWS